MKQKFMLIASMMLMCVMALSSCSKGPQTAEASVEFPHNNLKVSVEVPAQMVNDSLVKKYDFTKQKPENAISSGNYYMDIEGKCVMIVELTSFVYHTHVEYKEKYGENENPSTQDQFKIVSVGECGTKSVYSNVQETKVCGDRYAFTRNCTEGKDMFYHIDVKDITGNPLSFVIEFQLKKGQEANIDEIMKDPEVQAIINSLKLTALK